MAGNYLKLAIVGSCQSQSIVNVLYYGMAGGAPSTTWGSAEQLDLIDAWGETLTALYVASMNASYTLTNLIASLVDQRGVLDPTTNAYQVGQNVPGDIADNLDGPYQTSIVGFTTEPAIEAALPMKRSYIAYGPVSNSFVLDTGKLSPSWNSGTLALLVALKSPIGGAVDTYYPVRVGRTVAPAPIRVGLVLDAFMRPYASTRKSRKVRPTGP